MPWDLNTDKPIYLQLVDIISHRIISGTYSTGDKLPSVRDLAKEAAVNPNTMQKALSELEGTGLIYSNRTSGRFVTTDESLIKNAKDRIAREFTGEYISKIKNLGLSDEDLKNLLAEML